MRNESDDAASHTVNSLKAAACGVPSCAAAVDFM